MKYFLDGKEIKDLQILENIREEWTGIDFTTKKSIELEYIDIEKQEMYFFKELIK